MKLEPVDFTAVDVDLRRMRGLLRRMAKSHRKNTGASIHESVRVAQLYMAHQFARRLTPRLREAVAFVRVALSHAKS